MLIHDIVLKQEHVLKAIRVWRSMNIVSFATKDISSIEKEFGTSCKNGLTEKQVLVQRRTYGSNEFKKISVRWWHILLRQLRSSFTYLLFAAAILSFFLGELVNASMILLFLFINIALGFYQEFFAQRTFELLKKYIVSQVLITRDGKTLKVYTTDLVPGDLVHLELGDIVPADIRLITTQDLMLDESTITGESAAISKSAQALEQDIKEIYNASNIAFASSKVVYGKADGIVIATGTSSVIGTIAQTTETTYQQSSFTREIDKYSNFIIFLVISTLIISFLVNLALKHNSIDAPTLLIFSISLAVTIIPEALPVVIIFARSIGARKLARKEVIIKRLSALEDLGGTQILCTDKTGTLTENNLAVDEAFGKDIELVYKRALIAGPNPDETPTLFDQALQNYVEKNAITLTTNIEYIDEIPFDPHRRFSSQLIKEDDGYKALLRGAPEEILRDCQGDDKKIIQEWIAVKENQGFRVLAVAEVDFGQSKPTDWKEQLIKPSFIGLVAFTDPLKKTALHTIDHARQLQVTIKMLTGDSAVIGAHIAHELGIISTKEQVIIGSELISLNQEEQEAAVERCNVFARISPEEKIIIINLLAKKYAVTFLGEGVNDAPALKAAQVGIAVHNATSIAQDAADVIILRNNLNIIIEGIQEGRLVFVNTLKYIKSTLASNLSNFYTLVIATLLLNYLPMLPLQILLVNLLSDLPLIAIATDNVDKYELKRPKEYSMYSILTNTMLFSFICTFFDFVFLSKLYQGNPAILQTNWFIFSIVTEFIFFFAIRSKKFFLISTRPSTPILVLTGLSLMITLLLPQTHIGATLFDFVAPTYNQLSWIFFVVFLNLATLELAKWFMYRNNNHVTQQSHHHE